MIGVSTPTVTRMVRDGELPPPHKILSRCSMYSRAGVRAALGMMDDPTRSELLTPAATAALIGVSLPRLQTMRVAGTGPQPVRQGKRGVRYVRSEVLAYLDGKADSTQYFESSAA
jgi:predicted DNA-binding transcriptional regulator AlpA